MDEIYNLEKELIEVLHWNIFTYIKNWNWPCIFDVNYLILKIFMSR